MEPIYTAKQKLYELLKAVNQERPLNQSQLETMVAQTIDWLSVAIAEESTRHTLQELHNILAPLNSGDTFGYDLYQALGRQIYGGD